MMKPGKLYFYRGIAASGLTIYLNYDSGDDTRVDHLDNDGRDWTAEPFVFLRSEQDNFNRNHALILTHNGQVGWIFNIGPTHEQFVEAKKEL